MRQTKLPPPNKNLANAFFHVNNHLLLVSFKNICFETCSNFIVRRYLRVFLKTRIFLIHNYIFYEVTTHTLPHLKCIRWVSVRSSFLPFEMHEVGFRAFKSTLYEHGRANRTELFWQLFVRYISSLSRAAKAMGHLM